MEWLVKEKEDREGKKKGEREVDREHEEMVEYCHLSLGRWVISVEAQERSPKSE